MPLGFQQPILCFLEIDSLLMTATRTTCVSAFRAFELVNQLNAATIIYSGLTRAELEYLMKAIGVWHPYIAEDGSVVGVPRGYFGRRIDGAKRELFWDVIDYGRPHDSVTDIVDETLKRMGLRAVRLSALPTQTIAEVFGLSRPLAARARKRAHGDVVKLLDATECDIADVTAALGEEGLRCARRGDALYIVGDTGGNRAVLTLKRLYDEHLVGARAIGLIDRYATGMMISAMESVIEADSTSLAELGKQMIEIVSATRRSVCH